MPRQGGNFQSKSLPCACTICSNINSDLFNISQVSIQLVHQNPKVYVHSSWNSCFQNVDFVLIFSSACCLTVIHPALSLLAQPPVWVFSNYPDEKIGQKTCPPKKPSSPLCVMILLAQLLDNFRTSFSLKMSRKFLMVGLLLVRIAYLKHLHSLILSPLLLLGSSDSMQETKT